MFKAKEILNELKGSSIKDPASRIQHPASSVIKGISIDTRTVKPGDLFIPLKGNKFDGKRFAVEALRKGASVLEVKDGLKALQALAAYHRSKFKIPIIGVTGSVGKTTTKDMIAAILSQEMPTLKNEENLNNEIGVPLTLLKLSKKHKAAVIEMAMQDLGEIELLARIAKPTIAVVTNIGEAHLEFLKTKKNIAKAKAEIFKYLGKRDHAIINQDDEYFEHLKSSIQHQASSIITFGIIEKAKITPAKLKGINLPVPGEHNVYNALAAIAVAKILRIKKSLIKKGLEGFRPSSKRWDVINLKDGTKIINDTYNANPQSMAAALKTLAVLEGRKIAVLGDMFELGKRTTAAHKHIGVLSRKLGIDILLSIGNASKSMCANYHYLDKTKAIKKLKKIVRPGDRILVKASRSMRLEDVVEAIRNI